MITCRGTTSSFTIQGRRVGAPATTIATCGGWMIENTASTAASQRLVKNMVGAESSLARRRPARARITIPQKSSISGASGFSAVSMTAGATSPPPRRATAAPT